MNQKDEKWAIFWCDLLAPVIYKEIEPEQVNQYLKQIAQKEVVFPDGKVAKPSLSRLRRKLNRYRQGGFKAMGRKPRCDRNKPRKVTEEVIACAVELKKEQPKRSHKTINHFLKDLYGQVLARSTLYWHLKKAGATRLKLDISSQKVRRRWTKKHTHDTWVGDFEQGPYVIEGNHVLPTSLSAFIDCHSRYVVEARYYLKQNLDILIDSLIRALSVHGAPKMLYLDNAKVYLSHGLSAACHTINVRLTHRKAGDPAGGGIIERFFQTVQDQFEAEVRAGDILNLEQLNRAFNAWLTVSYHAEIHSETRHPPKQRYQSGLKVS